jgi:hypothetical protein
MSPRHRDKKISKDENAKNPAWKTPMDMPGVAPGTYDASMGAPGGTDKAMGEAAAAGRSLSARTGPLSPRARRLATRKDISG